MDPYNLDLDDFDDLDEICTETPVAGVYVLSDPRGHVLYVGQSADIRKRLKVHARRAWWPQVASTLVWEHEDVTTRLVAETVLCMRHFPKHVRTVAISLAPSTRTLRELHKKSLFK